MNKNMNLPAEYAVLSEEEMTYTQGGSDIGGFATTAATVVGAVVLGASYIWDISASKDWLNKKSNREQPLHRWAAPDMLSVRICPSPQPTCLDAVSSTMVVALAPLSAVLLSL